MNGYDLYLGDCLEVMDKLIEQGVVVDMILCDPPFGTTNCKWDTIIPFNEMWIRIDKLIKPNGAILLFGSEPFSSMLRVSNIKKYKYEWIWDKVVGSGHLTAKHRPLQRSENISVFYSKKCTYNPQMTERSSKEYKDITAKANIAKTKVGSELWGGKRLSGEDRNMENYKKKHPTNILTYNKLAGECNNRSRVHPTQKPVALLEYLIKTYTEENEVVLDFTMGSGSTGVACMNTNRKFIGIELEEKYYNIAVNRIKGGM